MERANKKLSMAKIQPQTTGAGSQSLSIGWEDFIKGVSTSNTLPDAGFSPSSYNVNLIANRGRITPTALLNIDGGIQASNNNIIATCPYVDGSTGFSTKVAGIDASGAYLKRSTSAGSIWILAATDTGKTYTSGISDIISFLDSGGTNCCFGAQNQNNADITKIFMDSGTFSSNWFHTNFGIYLQNDYPHPMVIFNKNLYIADGIYLHKYDGGTGYTKYQLTIENYNVITALAIDPNTGKMMVAYTSVTTPTYWGGTNISKIGLYDGTNPTQFVKLVQVDDVVRAMFNNGGNIYIGYGYNFGMWNGSGITYLRELSTPLYKNGITSIGNDIYFIDGNDIYVYTEIQVGGKKVFNKVIGTSYPMQFVTNIDGKSLLNFGNKNGSTYNVYTVNMLSAGDYTQTALFQSNHYSFPRPIYVRAIDIVTDSTLGANDTIVASFIDDLGTENNFTPTTGLAGASTPRSIRLQGGSDKTLTLQLKLTMNTSVPFRRAIIYYDFAE